jgi:hypothetical protein
VKNVKTVIDFKRSYKNHRELAAPPEREKDLESRYTRKTLPERSQ